jgi:hypothetical protein
MLAVEEFLQACPCLRVRTFRRVFEQSAETAAIGFLWPWPCPEALDVAQEHMDPEPGWPAVATKDTEQTAEGVSRCRHVAEDGSRERVGGTRNRASALTSEWLLEALM